MFLKNSASETNKAHLLSFFTAPSYLVERVSHCKRSNQQLLISHVGDLAVYDRWGKRSFNMDHSVEADSATCSQALIWHVCSQLVDAVRLSTSLIRFQWFSDVMLSPFCPIGRHWSTCHHCLCHWVPWTSQVSCLPTYWKK